MTAVQIGALNADILRNLGKISEDETVLQRVAKYLRKQAKAVTDDSTRMTEEEYVSRVEDARKAYKEGRCTSFANADDLDRFIRSL